jgi:adenine/guanine/hypoxanthine permease
MNRYAWVGRGDVNAFFGLMIDNVAVMVLLVSLVGKATAAEAMEGQGAFTADFVMTYMIPGTALGVFVGDILYTWMAFRLARRSGRDVTAMPLGLDTPSTFGVAFLVLLPSLQTEYARLQGSGISAADAHPLAMFFAWHVGLAVLVFIGLFKVLFAPFGNAVRNWVPRAGLLGSLTAIALALIAFLPLLEVAAIPPVGLLALTVILITLVAHRELPGKFPGALAALLIGIAAYYLLHALQPPPAGAEGGSAVAGSALPAWPAATVGFEWWGHVATAALLKMPVALPFALATIVGGIDCTESAAAAGDEYDTRTILLTEGVASVIAGLFGGVIQNTPYIGHPAYKKMGGRAAAYTLATALFIGFLGYSGWFVHVFAWLPKEAMFPILVFVGLEITAQTFRATPSHHYPALALAALPALAYLGIILFNSVGDVNPQLPFQVRNVQTLRCLANGFIVTSLLWASALACLLDGRYVRSAAYLLISAGLSLVGVIHSPLRDTVIDLPWRVLPQVQEQFRGAVAYQTPYHWAGAYVLAAGVLLVLACLPGASTPADVSAEQKE